MMLINQFLSWLRRATYPVHLFFYTYLPPKVVRQPESPNGDDAGDDDAQQRRLGNAASMEAVENLGANGHGIGEDVA